MDDCPHGQQPHKCETCEVIAERDRLRALLTQTVNDGEWILIARTVHADLLAERDRLRAIVDVTDDFWPVIESICDQARASWEHDDPRMKYVTVQIDKVDLPTLNAAYRLDVSGPMGGTTS